MIPPFVIARSLGAVAAGTAVGFALASTLDRFYTAPAASRTPGAQRLRFLLLPPAAATLFLAASLRAGDPRQFLLMAAFGAALLALTATDLERHLLPNRIMYPCLLAALLASFAWPGRAPLSGLAGGVAGAAAMLLAYIVFPGFGFGDVKLAGLIGLLLGFPGVFWGLFTGMILGGVGAAFLLLTRRARLHTAIAYGPYLAAGAILEMLLRR